MLFLLYYYSYEYPYLVILNSSQTIFADETTAPTYEPAILRNRAPIKLPDWLILDIFVNENLMPIL